MTAVYMHTNHKHSNETSQRPSSNTLTTYSTCIPRLQSKKDMQRHTKTLTNEQKQAMADNYK